jgi:putative phosphoesterase
VKTLVGVISDTHGLLRPEVPGVFDHVDLILHAGDIGSMEVLDKLRSIAPVVAVRGNNDTGDWASGIPETKIAEIGGLQIYLLHDLKELDLNPAAAGFHAIVSGHSHRPCVEKRDGVLFLNPGSAGPRRFTLPVTVALLTIDNSAANADLVPILKA